MQSTHLQRGGGWVYKAISITATSTGLIDDKQEVA